MNNKAYAMKNEIRAISGYRALIISKFFLSVSLILSTLYIGFFGYQISPFYIFLVLNLLPPILSYALKDYVKRYQFKLLKQIAEDTPFHLSTLKKKYHYSRLGYVTNSISFLFSLVFLFLWQYNCSTTPNTISTILYQPTFFILTSILIRFTGIIFYRIKLPIDLVNNRV